MSQPSLLQGTRLRLIAPDAAPAAEHFSRWAHNLTYARLLDTDPARIWSVDTVKKWFEDEEKSGGAPTSVIWLMQKLEDEQIIGFIGLDGIRWEHGDTWVGIGIGEESLWGQGYGSEAMQLAVQYAFTVLNLQRVTLCVFEYNPRAIRSYEKVGFVIEGRERGVILRSGKRYDLVYMGILRAEWQQRQTQTQPAAR